MKNQESTKHLKELSRHELKKIIGGLAPIGDSGSTSCSSNSDCPAKTRDCADGTSFIAKGFCNSGTCLWAACS